MPLIESSSYCAPSALRNGHVSTIFTSLFRKAPVPRYYRETVQTPDQDFLDLDLGFAGERAASGGSRVVVLLHGLEGSAGSHYVRAMSAAIQAVGWNTVGLNFRGCSGRPNKTARSYHSGVTEDLQVVVEWTEKRFPGCQIALVGFSLGGNVLLRYMGEGSRRPSVVGGVAVSVPCDLTGSAKVLAKPVNQIYMRRFMKDLVRKLEIKNEVLGTDFDIDTFRKMKTFAEFDGAYTGPIHGFASAEEYWEKCSSRPFLYNIEVPTLLINARNDPFLSENCFPTEIAAANPHFYLEIPLEGGHVGFLSSIRKREGCWHEGRAVEFLRDKVMFDRPVGGDCVGRA